MTGKRGRFFEFEKYDGGSVKFVGEEATPICGKGAIFIYGKHLIMFVMLRVWDITSCVWVRCVIKVTDLSFTRLDVRSKRVQESWLQKTWELMAMSTI